MAAEGVEHRWIVTEFIRLCIFSWLEIRHTCCDLNKILKANIIGFLQQPLPRYLPDDLQRIQEEDAHLVAVLEEMVPLFDARYDTHEGSLQSFVDEILLPETKTVLDRLKQEDETLYVNGRREMGVVMVNE
ncbi:short chain dehydrogenase reductase family [Alternaria alternata]|nr:short chain dehydrogenase reductase family [Alternaria alternata]